MNALLKEAAKIPGLDENEVSDDEVWNGFQDDPPEEPIDHQEEYIDEDRYTTVTVEAVDVDKGGLHKVAGEDDPEDNGEAEYKKKAKAAAELEESRPKKVWPKKERKQKFRYESKAERRVTRAKQKAGNKSKADARRGNV